MIKSGELLIVYIIQENLSFKFTLADYCHCVIFLISSLCAYVRVRTCTCACTCSLRIFVSLSVDDRDVMTERTLNGDWLSY